MLPRLGNSSPAPLRLYLDNRASGPDHHWDTGRHGWVHLPEGIQTTVQLHAQFLDTDLFLHEDSYPISPEYFSDHPDYELES